MKKKNYRLALTTFLSLLGSQASFGQGLNEGIDGRNWGCINCQIMTPPPRQPQAPIPTPPPIPVPAPSLIPTSAPPLIPPPPPPPPPGPTPNPISISLFMPSPSPSPTPTYGSGGTPTTTGSTPTGGGYYPTGGGGYPTGGGYYPTGGGGYPTGGGSTPTPTPTPPPPPPCDKNQQTTVKNLITDPYLATSLAKVRASLQPPNTSIESGFGISKNNVGGVYTASPIVTGTSTDFSVTIGFDTSDPNYTPSAVVHTHPSGAYANPSAGDIYGLAGIYTSVNTITTSYVLAADGTTYAMVVNDPTALANFLATYPASANQLKDSFNPLSPMGGLYQDAYESFRNSGLSIDVAAERANAVVMAEAGINLLKAPANSTDLKQIQGTKVQDSNGNCTFTKSDCP